jgi:hypothetical protein
MISSFDEREEEKKIRHACALTESDKFEMSLISYRKGFHEAIDELTILRAENDNLLKKIELLNAEISRK